MYPTLFCHETEKWINLINFSLLLSSLYDNVTHIHHRKHESLLEETHHIIYLYMYMEPGIILYVLYTTCEIAFQSLQTCTIKDKIPSIQFYMLYALYMYIEKYTLLKIIFHFQEKKEEE